jgi:hypothetical protein
MPRHVRLLPLLLFLLAATALAVWDARTGDASQLVSAALVAPPAPAAVPAAQASPSPTPPPAGAILGPVVSPFARCGGAGEIDNEPGSAAHARPPTAGAAGAGPIVLAPRNGAAVLQPPSITFDGNANENSSPGGTARNPADVSGAIGPTYYMQVVNTAVSIFDRTGANVCLSPLETSEFWAGLPGCAGVYRDAVVLYDRFADRWVLSRFAGRNFLPTSPPRVYTQCLAVSTTPDPTGSWYRYSFDISTQWYGDYPKLSIWSDGYYYTANPDKIFSRTGGFAAVFERDRILTGAPNARAILFTIGGGGTQQFHMLPADLDGRRLPPAGSPAYFVRSEDTDLGFPTDQLQVFAFRTNWVQPSLSTFASVAQLPVAPFNANACVAQPCIHQKDTSLKLDSLSYGYLMYRLNYRNFGTYESILLSQTVNAGTPDIAGIRWYELRKQGTGGWQLFQQQTYTAPNPGTEQRHVWLGSIAQDAQGNIALAFNTSSPSIHPSIHYTGRLAGDPPGTMTQPEQVLRTGGGSQSPPATIFFGDYVQLTVDPLDDCTFWHGSQYYTSNAAGQEMDWHTRIGAFKFATCTGAQPSPPPGSVALAINPTPSNIAPGAVRTVALEMTATPPGVTSWRVDVQFDPAVVQVTGCTAAGGAIGSCTRLGPLLRITGSTPTPAFGSVVVAQINLQAVGPLGSTTPLTITPLDLRGPDNAVLPGAATNGSVTIAPVP